MSDARIKNKSLSYIINPSNELKGHHSIGVNCLLHNPFDNSLISGGRDGQISIWKLKDSNRVNYNDNNNAENNSSNSNNNSDDKNISNRLSLSSSIAVKSFITKNWQNEEEITQIENRIRSNGLKWDANGSDLQQPLLSKCNNPHLDWVNDLALLDSSSVASCSNDMSIKIWNYNTDITVKLGHHSDYVKKISFTPHFKTQLVSGGLDNSINIWDLTKGSILSNLTLKNESESIYALDTYNNMIITGGPTNSISLFDRRDMRKSIRKFIGHTDNIRSLLLKENSFLSGSSDTCIKLWDLRSTRMLKTLDMHDSPVWSLQTPHDSNDFSIFYSGDKNGLIFKTDLRASNLDLNSSITTDGYLNYKLNETIGLSTLISNNNSLSNNNLASTSGITSIALNSKANQIWSSTISSAQNNNTQFISSWSDPNMQDFVLYQGIKMTRKVMSLNAPSSKHASFELNRLGVNTSETDLVSLLSNDDLDQIDRALNLPGLNLTLTNTGNEITINVDETDTENDEQEIEQLVVNDNYLNNLFTCFVQINGELNTDFLLDLSTDKSIKTAANTSDLFSNVEITKSQIINMENLESVNVLPFNDKPLLNISGTSSFIRCKLLDSRRHVATMDSKGLIYIYDIISCELVKDIDNTINNSKATDKENFKLYASSENMNQLDKFEAICATFQTNENLPKWCSVQVKAGKLFITLTENNFVSCDIYSDDFEGMYPDLNLQLDELVRFNLGKIVISSFFKYWVDEISKIYQIQNTKPPMMLRNGSVFSIEENKQQLRPSPSKPQAHHSQPPSSSLTANKNSDKSNERDNKEKKKSFFGRLRVKDEKITTTPPPSSSSAEAINTNKIYTTEALLNYITNHSKFQRPFIPIFDYQNKLVTVVINEQFRPSGEFRPMYMISASKLSSISSNFHVAKELINILPIWITQGLLMDKWPTIPSGARVGFSFQRHPDSNLPDVESTRFNATGSLRIQRISNFLKGLKGIPENLEIELFCNDVALDPKMTLATVKARIWKNGKDVKFLYKAA